MIEAAKVLKRAGVLSDRVKLHGGKFISRGVLKRVREFGYIAENKYVAVPVKRELAQRARDAGYVVVRGNRIVIPNEAKRKHALQRNELAGVVPVRGGTMEIVHLPGSIMDMHGLVHKLQTRKGIDDLKAPDEMFAFQFFGHMSYRPFVDTESLLEYLTHYEAVFDGDDVTDDPTQEVFQNLVILRMRPGDYSPPSPEARRQAARTRRRSSRETQDRRYADAPRRGQPSRSEMLPAKANRLRADDRERAAAARAAMDAATKEAYKAAAKARAKASRDARKNRGQ